MLEVRNLNVFYDKVHVLKDLNIQLDQGECIALLGANGAGKSTLMNTISGIAESASGEILLGGQNLCALPAYEIVRKGISQVPEGRQIFSHLSVMDNLRLGAYIRSGASKKNEFQEDVNTAFEMFPRLKERRNQLSGTLSGGEQQMLAIARALMSRPKILLLDEPSLGLAPLVVKFIFETISRLREELKISVLMVEQNARAALKIAERGYILETGKIVLQDESSALENNPDVQKAFLGGM